MARSSSDCSEDVSYVNIHGNDVRVLVCSKTGRILIPIDELKEMGFSIYSKSQYNKLLVDDTQFTNEFNLYMLQSAQTYMLKHKVAFKENEILESINKCKKLLTECPNSNGISPSADINNFKQPAPMTIQNVNAFNDRKVTSYSRRSSTSSSDTSKQSKNFVNKEVTNSANKNPRNAFQQRKSQNFNTQNHVSPPYTKQQDPKWEIKRPPLHNKTTPLEVRPLHSVILEKPEHNIIVTYVDEKSPNAIWGQDVDNADTLLDIDEKIKEELKNERVVNRCEFHNIYLAQDDDAWFRCKVIKFRPLTVCFIDYGNTAQVTEKDLRKVSKDLASIPAQAVRIILEDGSKPSLYETITVKIINKTERGTYTATIVNEKTPVKKREKKKPVEAPKEPEPQVPIYFNKIPLRCTLQNAQKIMIVGEANGKLAVRTKESFDKLKEVEEAMKSVDFTPLPEKPKKNQVVVARIDDKWRRGEVIRADSTITNVLVNLLDYHEQVQLDPSQLRNITESLYKEPMTYRMTPPLKGYHAGDQKALEYLRKLVSEHAKPLVVLDDEEFDLKIDGSLLSEDLATLNNRIMLKDLQRYRPPIGPGTYMLYACRDVDNVTLVSQEEVEKYVDQVIKTEADDDEEPYVPIVGEVCLGVYQGSWSRCVIVRVMNGRFEVRYVDFGNVEFLKPDQLKKLSPDGTTAPILGVHCRFTDLPPVKNVDELITQFIEDGDSYDLVIKGFDGSCYEIEAPEIYSKIKSN